MFSTRSLLTNQDLLPVPTHPYSVSVVQTYFELDFDFISISLTRFLLHHLNNSALGMLLMEVPTGVDLADIVPSLPTTAMEAWQNKGRFWVSGEPRSVLSVLVSPCLDEFIQEVGINLERMGIRAPGDRVSAPRSTTVIPAVHIIVLKLSIRPEPGMTCLHRRCPFNQYPPFPETSGG